MTQSPDPERGIEISLPLTTQEGWVLLTVLGIALLSVSIFIVLQFGFSATPLEGRRTRSTVEVLAWTFFPAWLAMLFLVLFHFVELLSTLQSAMGSAEALRGYAGAFGGLVLALSALVSVPFALIRVYTTERQTRTAEQGHITDRISKAVEQLGAEKTVRRQRINQEGSRLYEDDNSGKPDYKKPIFEEVTTPNIEVRLGGIYALERIAQDSVRYDQGRDHIQVMEILCAYIRENSPTTNITKSPSGTYENLINSGMSEYDAIDQTTGGEDMEVADEIFLSNLPLLRTDVQAALTVIGRRNAKQVDLERRTNTRVSRSGYRLDLRNTNLRRADLYAFNLDYARLRKSHFERARLSVTSLKFADLRETHLDGVYCFAGHLDDADVSNSRWNSAHFAGATLERVNFDSSYLRGTNFTKCMMDLSSFKDAKMEGATLAGSLLGGANFANANLTGANMSDVQMERSWLCGAELNGVSFQRAKLRGVAIQGCDLSNSSISQEQLDVTYGGGRTAIPKDQSRPSHWLEQLIDDDNFDNLWQIWCNSNGVPTRVQFGYSATRMPGTTLIFEVPPGG